MKTSLKNDLTPEKIKEDEVKGTRNKYDPVNTNSRGCILSD